MIDKNYLKLLQRHRQGVIALAASNDRYTDTGFAAHKAILAPGELEDRIVFCNSLRLAIGQSVQLNNEALLESCAEIADAAFGLGYETKAQTGAWIPNEGLSPSDEHRLPQRSKNYLDRAMSKDGVRSFPMIDMALIAASFGLPLALWEAENRNAFKEFVSLEDARRRGSAAIIPILAFDSLDYLRTLAIDTTALEIFSNRNLAAAAGIASAQMPEENSARRQTFRAARPVASVPDFPADQQLWFRCPLPEEFGNTCEVLLFETYRSGDSTTPDQRSISLLSTAYAHDNNTACAGQFVSPILPGTGVQLSPSHDSEIILLITRKHAKAESLNALGFFHRTSKVDASLELNSVDLDDLRRCLLRIEPADRRVLRRKIRLR